MAKTVDEIEINAGRARRPGRKSGGAEIAQALSGEASLLMAALSAAWSASLIRTSIFLAVLSAAGVALGIVAQGGMGIEGFRRFALIILPIVLFLGLATFIRLVQVQRESIVYITGLNRIRHFILQRVPESRPYFVLPAHDDEAALYRSPGTGMTLRPPRFRLVYLLVQTQGVVGLLNAVVAAGIGGMLAETVAAGTGWAAAVLSFVVVLAGQLAYWQRSLAELLRSIRPISPTPPDEFGAPF